jgi:hypothetical protein
MGHRLGLLGISTLNFIQADAAGVEARSELTHSRGEEGPTVHVLLFRDWPTKGRGEINRVASRLGHCDVAVGLGLMCQAPTGCACSTT